MSTAVVTLPVPASQVQPLSEFWRHLAKVFALAVAVRLVWSFIVVQNGPMHGDAADYFRDATVFAQQNRLHEAFYWPPGTTYFLAAIFKLTGPSEAAARVGIALLAGLQAAAVGWLARSLSHSSMTGLVAGTLWAVYPPALFYADQTGSQHLSAFCLTAGILYGVRCLFAPHVKNVILCGLILGIGCLTRPSMMSIVALLPLMGLWTWWSSRKTEGPRTLFACLWPMGAAVTLAIAVMLPTAIFNARMGGGFTLSTNNERNFFIGNNPHTPWYKTSHLAQRDFADLPVETQQYLSQYYDAPQARQAMKAAAWEHIRQQPGLFALRTANRARAFWGFDYLASRTLQSRWHLPAPVFLLALLCEAGGYVLVMLLALYGLTRWKELDGDVRTWLVVGTAVYAAPYLLAFSAGTYHYPVLGLLIPFAAVALVDRERLVLPWQALRNEKWLVAAGLFMALQAEYLYFAVRFSA